MAENEEFFMKRISELERLLHRTSAESKKRKLAIRELTEERDRLKSSQEDMVREIESAKSRPPDEWELKYRAKEKEVWQRDHKEAWKEIATKKLVDGVPLEEIWGKIGYNPGSEVPGPDQILEQLEKARSVAPYLFRVDGPTDKPESQQGTKTPERDTRGRLAVTNGLDLSRGSRTANPGEYVISKSQLRDPNFFRLNQKSINEASKNNALVVTDD